MHEVRSLTRRAGLEHDLPQATLRREKGGFGMHMRDGIIVRVTWAEILEVRAYKMDLIKRDLVCLSILTGEDGVASRSVQLHEDMPGWYTLLEELQVNLPNCRQDWWAEVAFPAFATNERVIFKRERQPKVSQAA